MTDDDPLSTLRSIRKVDPAFADRLESSMRIQHAAARRTQPGRSPWRQALLLGPALVLVVLASAVLILRDEAQSSALVLHEAHNVVVTLPDGTSLIDPVGLELPDGAIMSVGIGGRAVIDDDEFGPGEAVRVEGGRLVPVDPADTTATAPSDATATGGSEPPITGAPVEQQSDARSDSPADVDRDQAPDSGTDTAPPARTEPPDREATDDQSDDAPSNTTIAPHPRDGADEDRDGIGDEGQHPDVDLALMVRIEDGAVVVGWGATGVGVADLRIVLLRSRGPDAPDPDWPLGDAVTIAYETTGSAPRRFLDELPGSGVVVRYRAVALLDDVVVARSAIRTLALDR